MYYISPVGFYDIIVDVVLTSVSVAAMATGDLITNNKVEIPYSFKQQGGGAELKSFYLFQQDTSAAADLEKTATDLYIFDNADALGVLVSNNPFVLDANTKVTNIIYHKAFLNTEWVDMDANNTILKATDLNTTMRTSEEAGYSFYFALVTRGTPTYSNHTLTARFVFRQSKTKD